MGGNNHAITRTALRRGTVVVGLIVLLFASVGLVASPATAAGEGDDFADAAAATLPFHQAIDLSGATKEPGEQRATCGWSHVESRWYRVVVPEGALGIKATLSDMQFFGNIVVFSGSQLSSLTQLGCRGVFDEGSVYAAAAPGTTLYVRVASEWMPQGGKAVLDIAGFTTPANDLKSSAEPISRMGEHHVGQLAGATADESDAACIGETGSIWFVYEAPVDQSLVVSQTGSDAYLVTGVYAAHSDGSTKLVSCNEDTVSGPESWFVAEKGTTYFIQVSGWSPVLADSEITLLFGASAGAYVPGVTEVGVGAAFYGEERHVYGYGYAPFSGVMYDRNENSQGGWEVVCYGAVLVGGCVFGST